MKKESDVIRDNCKNKLILLMAEISDCQETYKEELGVVALEYPLNQAIFVLSNALLAIKKKEEDLFYKITKDGVEIGRKPSMRHADTELRTIMAALPEDMPRAFDGQRLVVGNQNEGIAETVYMIVAP